MTFTLTWDTVLPRIFGGGSGVEKRRQPTAKRSTSEREEGEKEKTGASTKGKTSLASIKGKEGVRPTGTDDKKGKVV